MNDLRPENDESKREVEKIVDLSDIFSESWPAFKLSNRLVAAYQLGRLLNAENWIRFASEIWNSRTLFDKRTSVQDLAILVAGEFFSRGVVYQLRAHFEHAGDWFRSERHLMWMEDTSDTFTKRISDLWDHDWFEDLLPRFKRHLGSKECISIRIGSHLDQAIRRTRPIGVEPWESVFNCQVVCNSLPEWAQWRLIILKLFDPVEMPATAASLISEFRQQGPNEPTMSFVLSVDECLRRVLTRIAEESQEQPELPLPGHLGLQVNREKRLLGRREVGIRIDFHRKDVLWRIFYKLYTSPGQTFSRTELAQVTDSSEDAISEVISSLRKMLKPLGVTVQKKRYQLIEL